ncbi:MAG: hypothetical protein AABZ12_10150 [Planctomycetota bacterium]
MNAAARQTVVAYLTLVGVALATACVLAGVGFFPTRRFAGAEGLPAMLGGCTVSWLASCAGAAPLARMFSQAGRTNAAMLVLSSTGIRFLAALALVVPGVFSGWFDRTVFVAWTAISYLAMLAADTLFALWRLEQQKRTAGGTPGRDRVG